MFLIHCIGETCSDCDAIVAELLKVCDGKRTLHVSGSISILHIATQCLTSSSDTGVLYVIFLSSQATTGLREGDSDGGGVQHFRGNSRSFGSNNYGLSTLYA